MSACSSNSQSCQLVSPAAVCHISLSAHLSVSISENKKFQYTVLPSIIPSIVSSLISPLNKTSSSYVYAAGSERQMSSCPSFWLQLVSFRIPPCTAPYSCVYACQHVLECLFMFPYAFLLVCVCFTLLCSSVKPAVRVYSTWLTCSGRAGCQQQPRHFTSTLSDRHHCQEDCTSTSRFADAGCTARSLLVEGDVYGCACMSCTRGAICSISPKL